MGAPIGGLSAGVYNPNVAYRAANALRTQKCIITGFFNSNGLRDGMGLVGGLGHAMNQNNLRMFGVMPSTVGERDSQTNSLQLSTQQYSQRGWTGAGSTNKLAYNSGNSTSVGGLAASGSFRDPTVYPGFLTNYTFGQGYSGGSTSASYSLMYAPWVSEPGYSTNWRNSTTKCSGGVRMALGNTANNFFDPFNKNITLECWYGSVSLSGGAFSSGMRVGSVPNWFYPPPLAQVGDKGYLQSISANSGATGSTAMSMQRVNMTAISGVTATQIFADIGFAQTYNSSGSGFTGDMFIGYQVVYETGATSGAIVAPFWAVGGQSVYDFAYSLSAGNPIPTHDNTIDHWIDVMSAPITTTASGAVSQTPFFIWMIADAVNQTSETQPSIVGGYTSYSAEAYADNAKFVISKILSRWTAKGLSSDNCLFWLYPDHPFPASHPEYVNTRSRIQSYVTTGYDLVYASYPNNVFGSIPETYISATGMYNAGLTSDSYYAPSSITVLITGIPVISGASSSAIGVGISGTFSSGYTANNYVRLYGTNTTPACNGVFRLISGAPTVIRIDAAGTAITVAGNTGQISIVDTYHLNSGLTATPAITGAAIRNGYHFYTAMPFTDVLSSTYADLIRNGSGGITGVQTLNSSNSRKVFLVSGNGTESFTITSGATSGTANSWSASNLEMKTLGWSVAHGGTASGHVSVLWENQGSGGTHSTIMNCMDSNVIQYSAMGMAFKNPCDNPTGNLLIRSNLGASGAYTVLVELGMPTSGLTTGLP